jgi:hypothetical protein
MVLHVTRVGVGVSEYTTAFVNHGDPREDDLALRFAELLKTVGICVGKGGREISKKESGMTSQIIPDMSEVESLHGARGKPSGCDHRNQGDGKIQGSDFPYEPSSTHARDP